MERKIKEFSNGTYLSFDTGYFDDWCVYLTNRNGRRYSPKDSDYFTILKEYANKYGYKRIYGDFIQIYNLTGKVAELSVLQKNFDDSIYLSRRFGTFRYQFFQFFTWE